MSDSPLQNAAAADADADYAIYQKYKELVDAGAQVSPSELLQRVFGHLYERPVLAVNGQNFANNKARLEQIIQVYRTD